MKAIVKDAEVEGLRNRVLEILVLERSLAIHQVHVSRASGRRGSIQGTVDLDHFVVGVNALGVRFQVVPDVTKQGQLVSCKKEKLLPTFVPLF